MKIIINGFKKYRDLITTIIAICGVFFGVAGLYFSFIQIEQTRREEYLQYRPFVDIESINFNSEGIDINIQNNGLTIAKNINVQLFQKESYNSEPEFFPYQFPSNFLIGPIIINNTKCDHLSLFLWTGRLSPRSNKRISIYFCEEEQLEEIKEKEKYIGFKIKYEDYKGEYHELSSLFIFNKKNNRFDSIEETEDPVSTFKFFKI